MTTGLPLFPLATVLFPGLVLPLHIFEPRYRTLLRDLLDQPDSQTREFGVVAVRQGLEIAPAPDGSDAGVVDESTAGGAGPGRRTSGEPPPGMRPSDLSDESLYRIGCTAQLRQVTENPDGTFDIVTVGRRRFSIGDIDREAAPYLTASVEWLPEAMGEPGVAEELAPRVLAAFQRYLTLIRAETEGFGEQLPDDPTVLSHLVAASAMLTLDDRQRLLELPDTATRLKAERSLLSREAALLAQIRAVPVSLGDLAAPPSPN